jgi:multicomponent Na+:H+ antiporter subunit G
MIRELFVSFFLLVGGAFMFLAALGLIRMPDVFMRLQATTKASTLGAGSLLIATAIYFNEVDITARALLVLTFVMITAPAGAHAIARAAHTAKALMWERTIRDDLRAARDAEEESKP